MTHKNNNKKLTVTKRVEELEAYQLYQDKVFQELEDKIAKLEKNHTMLYEFVMKEFYRNHKLPEQN